MQWLFFCLKIVFDRKSFIYKLNHLSDKSLMKNIVKKNNIRIILFRTYEHLKLYIILYIFHVLTLSARGIFVWSCPWEAHSTPLRKSW